MKKKSCPNQLKRTQTRLAMLFITPWIIGFLAFSLYPIISTFYYSFTEYNLFSTPKWIGFSNYLSMLHDKNFTAALYNSLFYIIVGIPLQLLLSILTAILLNMNVKGRAVFRTLYYLPALVPPVAGALIWVWLLNPQYGLVNALLRMLHLPEPLWFSSAEWSKPAIILMMLWGIGNTMVVYLAGIGEIPRTYYEAMELDGGGSWHKFTKIIWPMLTPVTLFQLISGIINGFNLFTQAYVVSLTRGRLPGDIGGVGNSLLFYASNLYREGFTFLKFGYASAEAWFMLILVLLITFLILKTAPKWVHYGE